MPDDYYPDPDDQHPTEDEDSGESEGKTALIPKSLLGGKDFKVGDEVVLKITHEYEDEVAVEYAPAKPEGDTEEEPDELPGDEEFEEMDKKGAENA